MMKLSCASSNLAMYSVGLYGMIVLGLSVQGLYAGSLVSFLMGGSCGTALMLATWNSSRRGRAGRPVAMGVLLLLSIVFLTRYIAKGALLPLGLFMTSVVLLSWLLATNGNGCQKA